MASPVSEAMCDYVSHHDRIPPQLCRLMPAMVENPGQAHAVAEALSAIHDHALVMDDVLVQRRTQVWALQLAMKMVENGWVDARVSGMTVVLNRIGGEARYAHVRQQTVSALQACLV